MSNLCYFYAFFIQKQYKPFYLFKTCEMRLLSMAFHIQDSIVIDNIIGYSFFISSKLPKITFVMLLAKDNISNMEGNGK